VTFSEYTSDQDCATAGLVFECLSIRSCLRCSDDSQRSNWESRLITDLMRDYNRYARPTINVSKPVDTTIAFYLTKILGLVCIYIHRSYISRCVSSRARYNFEIFFVTQQDIGALAAVLPHCALRMTRVNFCSVIRYAHRWTYGIVIGPVVFAGLYRRAKRTDMSNNILHL